VHTQFSHVFSVRRPVTHFSQNNYNSPSSITHLFSVLLHVSASTGDHYQAFVHYINQKCTHTCLLCELAITNLNFILSFCSNRKIYKTVDFVVLNGDKIMNAYSTFDTASVVLKNP
jgi:hypothetical protein